MLAMLALCMYKTIPQMPYRSVYLFCILRDSSMLDSFTTLKMDNSQPSIQEVVKCTEGRGRGHVLCGARRLCDDYVSGHH